MRFHLRLTFLLGLLCAISVSAQPVAPVWESLPEIPQQRFAKAPRVHPDKYRATKLNKGELKRVLDRAALEAPGRKAKEIGEEISLPMPDGSQQRFRFVESPIMEPALAARFPEIKTYLGEGIDDPAASIRFDLTPSGFHAQILSPRGAVYIDPYFADDSELHVSYFKRDYPRRPDGFVCLAPQLEEPVALQREVPLERSGSVLRTYRLACAATAEYTQYHGGTVAGGMAAIVTAINRVNQVYEQEISVRLILVANNHLLVFTNTTADGYSNDNGSTMLGQNQTRIDSIIGNANYDIGHVFSTGGGGVAYIRSVCNNSLKAGGVTGLPAPVGDPFYIDYVAHEMGHQFGGNHTFNSSMGACGGGNRNASTAYEPGSGSSIQAYAGICGTDDLQPNSDPYFHFVSFDEILAHITGAANACAGKINTGNTVPTVSAGGSYTIPKSTPFTLTASGSDADGDALTYCWEERDLGASQTLADPDNGSSPLFRSFNPTPSPSRVFPALSSLLANTTSLGERLPTTSRNMQFRVTVRDNRPGGGGVNTADTQVAVNSAAGPFLVTAPNSNGTWSNAQFVTWNVAGTTASPINASFVNILLSTNGGVTYPIVLKSNTANDGSERIVLPNAFCNTARVKVEAVGNIFFDVSNANFTFIPFPPQSEIVIDSAILVAESCTPNNAVDPGETVTVDIALRNTGSLGAADISASLLSTGGVLAPSPSQVYGNLAVEGAVVSKPFTFQAAGSCGGEVSAVFEIRDGSSLLGYVTNRFSLGSTTLQVVRRTNAAALTVPSSGNSGPASTYPSAISLSGIVGSIAGVTVTLSNLSHAYPDDIDVLLVGPGNQKVLLMSDVGGATDVNNLTLTFSDAAPSQLPDGTGLSSGVFKPSDFETGESLPSPAPAGPYGTALGLLNGANPNGTWALYVLDDANPDKGSLANGWSIAITVAVPSCCTAPNTPPTVSTISDQVTDEDTSLSVPVVFADAETSAAGLTVTVTSSNTNVVANSGLVFTALGTNGNLNINPRLNQFGISTITLAVSDGFSTTAKTFLVTVNPVNDAPLLAAIGGKTIDEQTTLVVTNIASDIDSPAHTFSFMVTNAPPGVVIDSATGILTWTPTEAQGPGIFSIAVRVFDNGSPSLSDSKTFQVTVNEANTAPVLSAISDRIVHAGTIVILTNNASDADVPTNTLSYSLLNAPEGAGVHSASGIFSWATTDADANSTNSITVRVRDDGTPFLDATKAFSIRVIGRPEQLIALQGTNVVISWNSIPGQVYHLQSVTNLSLINAASISEVTAAGSVTAVTNVLEQQERFYRVVVP